jgi:thiamine transport system substrate-binding protein
VPQSLDDLTKPEYTGLLVVENPATSSPGLAFLLATVAHYGDSFTEYWQALKDNGVVVVDGWETAYYTIQRLRDGPCRWSFVRDLRLRR